MKRMIKLYGLSSCSHCKSLRNFLIDSDVEFDWTYVDMLVGEERNQTMKELKAFNPSCSFRRWWWRGKWWSDLRRIRSGN